jgi:hypothetical protein
MRLNEQGWRILSLLALCFACASFTAQFISQRSLWWDEVLLAFNVRERNLLELTQALDYDQAAPVGFLWLSKLISAPFAYSDNALRLVSLGAGMAMLALTALMAWRIQASMTPLVLVMLGTNQHLIYYANEFKQYMLDAALAMLLLNVAGSYLRQPSPRKLRVLALLGLIALWFSHPSLFVLAGCGGVLLWQARHDKRRIGQIIGMGMAWLASFGTVYVFFYRTTSANPALQNYWAEAFIAPNPLGLIRAFMELMTHVSGFFNLALLIICVFGLILGIYRLARHNTLLLLSPVLMAGIASLLHQYPFEGRLLTFALPAVTLVVVASWWDILRALAQVSRPVALMAGLALCGVLVQRPHLPLTKTEVRPLLEQIRAQDSQSALYAEPYAYAIADYYGYAPLPLADWTTERVGWQIYTGNLSNYAPTPNDEIPRQTLTEAGAYALFFSP